MPQDMSIEGVIVVLGAVLVLIGIVGDNIEIFGAKIPGVSSKRSRFIAAVFGVALIVVALDPFNFLSNSEKTEPCTSNYFAVKPDLSSPKPIPNLSISKGNTVIVTYEDGSRWNCKGGETEDWVGPSGNSSYKLDLRYMLDDAPFCSLIGRVGNGKWHNFGEEERFNADSSGDLVLTANDVKPKDCPLSNKDECYEDNEGVISVTVAVEDAVKE